MSKKNVQLFSNLSLSQAELPTGRLLFNQRELQRAGRSNSDKQDQQLS